MSRLPTVLSAAAALLALAACSPPGPAAPAPGKAARPALAFDKARLEAAIDQKFGGVGTCLVLVTTASGDEVYRYNSHGVCDRALPPCSTFKVPNSLIALDSGIVTPQTLLKWDGTPQPIRAHQKDADMATALKESITWWHREVGRRIGRETYEQRLKAFHYGNEQVTGPADGFWLGPTAGGGLGISTRQQAEFFRRLYTGRLPVSAESRQAVEAALVDEERAGHVMSGKTGTCSSAADGSREVAWWAGRLKTPTQDYVFAASLDTAAENALPGQELKERVKSAFVEAGLWPPA